MLTSYRSLSDENVVEEMEVEDPNILVVPAELTGDAITNIQLIHEMENRSEGLTIGDEEPEPSDDEDEEMPVVESGEMVEGKEEDGEHSSDGDCRDLSSSDSESHISQQSTKDGSRRAHQRRGSAASVTTVNAPVSSLSIVIDASEEKGKGMFDVEDSDDIEPRERRTEEMVETCRNRRCTQKTLDRFTQMTLGTSISSFMMLVGGWGPAFF